MKLGELKELARKLAFVDDECEVVVHTNGGVERKIQDLEFHLMQGEGKVVIKAL